MYSTESIRWRASRLTTFSETNNMFLRTRNPWLTIQWRQRPPRKTGSKHLSGQRNLLRRKICKVTTMPKGLTMWRGPSTSRRRRSRVMQVRWTMMCKTLPLQRRPVITGEARCTSSTQVPTRSQLRGGKDSAKGSPRVDWLLYSSRPL